MDPTIIDRLADARVLVVGDVLLDRFVEGHVTRISREAPVPVLRYGAARAVMGAACNVAANILSTGGTVTLVGLTGADGAAGELGALCRGFARLTAHLIADPARRTTVKTRYLSGWQQLLCIDEEDALPASAAISAALLDAATRAIDAASAVVISDYGRGALDDATIRALIRAARAAGKPMPASSPAPRSSRRTSRKWPSSPASMRIPTRAR
jgi:D-beta-D-heptose 7-phosphate kinase/D-beta-D-heptose 1-phosphate adenosyltransferase